MFSISSRYPAFLVLGAGIVLMALMAFPCAAQDDSPTLAPQNPTFLEYLKDPYMAFQQDAESGIKGGIVPEPIDFSYLKDIVGGKGIVALEVLPTSYDLRTLNRLTPIRNQGGCGSCWSFASYGSVESNLKPGESLDFSENNLKNQHGFDIACCDGGNRSMATAYLARWEGAISEQQDPYSAGSCTSPSSLTSAKHVQEVIFIPTRSGFLDNDTLKQAVMQYGAVYTSYYHGDAYYKSSTGAYYYNGTNQPNHGVCIVGWDDNYDKSNFLTPPPGNGAFIIRNSWGTWWGLSGYYYMSYYDTQLSSENAAFTAESGTNYDGIYQYDMLGWTGSAGYGGNTAWFGNVFTAVATSNVAAASFYTASPNSTYEVRVYVNPTNGPVNASGPVATVTGSIALEGYHTVKLPTPVPITTGQKFSVVVKLTTPGYGYPVPLERPYSGYSSIATASAGQSFMSSNGTSWSDVATSYGNSNVCVKAFTTGSGGPAPGALSVTPATGLTASGDPGGPFNPSSQVYTLTNTGDSSIDWSAAKTKSWVTLSSAGGTLAAGASTTVTVSINAAANSLTAGSYSDTATFTDTTKSVSATRAVALTVLAPGSLSVTPATGLTASGTAGGPFSPSNQQYTLTNTGGETINWTASVTQPWVTLSLTGGTLAVGASATATVSINSNANGLIAGVYPDIVTFANTTNGSGNTARNVSLTVTAPIPVTGYQVGPTTFSWIDPTSHAAITLSDNSASTPRALPFSFGFYGKSYSLIYIGSNGLLGFSSSGMTNYGNSNLPYAYLPNKAIYPYWDNLNPASGGSVRMGVVGSAPNRKVVVSWVGVPSNYASTVKFTFQAVLCEGSNNIIFQYLTTAITNATYGRGKSATIGIENETGTEACKYSYNTQSISDGQALLFSMDPLAPLPGSLSVTPTTGLSASGLAGGPFSPSNETYTLTNDGGEAINWTAGKTQPWVTLSSTGGALAAGASTTVTVSINSAANSLAIGSYSDTVTFSNTTNGSGSTTRPVGLTVNDSLPPPPPTGYQVKPTTFGWIDPTSHSTMVLANNKASAAQSIPFAFDFYGTSSSSLYIGSNGLISLKSGSGLYSSYNSNLPTANNPNGIVCAYWDSLNLTGGQVKIGVVGSAPNRKVVVSWVNVAHSSSSTTKFTFQAILCEGTNDIIVQHLLSGSSSTTYGGGKSATIGIENQAGTGACVFSYNTRSLSDNTALLFTTH